MAKIKIKPKSLILQFIMFPGSDSSYKVAPVKIDKSFNIILVKSPLPGTVIAQTLKFGFKTILIYLPHL